MDWMFQGNLMLAVLLFMIGAIGMIWKANTIAMFLCVELMLNAANLAFMTFAQGMGQPEKVTVFLFVITVAAAEAAVGLALFIKIFNGQETLEAETLNQLKH